MIKHTLMNMCMIYDEDSGRVLVQDKINSRWAGITFPGGHVADGESIYESAVREVNEETGLTVYDLQQVGLIHMFDVSSQERRMIFLYKATVFDGEVISGTHEGKVYWVCLHELESMQLAPNMKEYLRLFLDSDVVEAYITRNAAGDNDFTFLPAISRDKMNEHK